MSFRFAESAHKQIREYLDQIEDQGNAFVASAELHAGFAKIAANPRIGIAGPTGPLENRRFHVFRLAGVDGRERLAHVAYRVATDGCIEILAFSAVPA